MNQDNSHPKIIEAINEVLILIKKELDRKEKVKQRRKTRKGKN